MNSTRTRGLGVVLTLVIAHGALSVLTESPSGRDGREDGRSRHGSIPFFANFRLDLYPLLRLRLFIFLLYGYLVAVGQVETTFAAPNRDVVSAASNDGFSRPNF